MLCSRKNDRTWPSSKPTSPYPGGKAGRSTEGGGCWNGPGGGAFGSTGKIGLRPGGGGPKRPGLLTVGGGCAKMAGFGDVEEAKGPVFASSSATLSPQRVFLAETCF